MFLTKNIISHRGIYDNKKIFENTLPAFKKALSKGYTIELDIHLTKDNNMIVFHDYNTKRMTNIDKVVEESTYQELNKQKILHIPTLEEVLKLVNGKVPLLIEIKQNQKVGPLEKKLMDILKKYNGQYAIQSFNPKTIYWFKKNNPNVIRGQLSYSNHSYNPIKRFIFRKMFFNLITKPNFISYRYNDLTIKQINKYRKKGIIIIAWTINSKKNYEKYKDIYDNLICENFI